MRRRGFVAVREEKEWELPLKGLLRNGAAAVP